MADTGRLGKFTGHVCLVNLPRGSEELYVPLGILSLASAVQRRGGSVEIIDFELMQKAGQIPCEDAFFAEALKKAQATGATVFGITADCSNYPLAMHFAGLLRQACGDAIIVLGGPHATFTAVETLEAFSEIDFIVIGEGEVTFPELLDALVDENALAKVRGIAFRKDGGVFLTGQRTLVDDLGTIPTPAYALLPMNDYLRLSGGPGENPFISLEAGRGCPKNCYYCSTSRLWKRANRNKEPGQIFREMKALGTDHGVSAFVLIHDNFVANRKFTEDFCSLLIDAASPFRWSASASTDRLSSELIRTMSRAGCTRIFLGIESGSPRMQGIMGKRLDLDHADSMVAACIDAGMDTSTAFIVGFPEETEDDLAMTLNRVLRYRQQGAATQVTQLAAFPGTPLHESCAGALELGDIPPDVSPHIARFQGQRQLIAGHPELFSSFYTVRNESSPRIVPRALVDFFDVVQQHYSQAFSNVVTAAARLGDDVMDVYRFWECWRREHVEGTLDAEKIFYSFNGFLDAFGERLYQRMGR